MPRVPSRVLRKPMLCVPYLSTSAQARQRVTQDPHNTSILTSKLHKELIRLTRQPYRKARLDILFLSIMLLGFPTVRTRLKQGTDRRAYLSQSDQHTHPERRRHLRHFQTSEGRATLSLLKLRAMLKHCLQIGVTGSAIDLASRDVRCSPTRRICVNVSSLRGWMTLSPKSKTPTTTSVPSPTVA